MTNTFKRVLLSTAALLILGSASSFANTVLKVGATPVPHAEILNAVKDKLAKEGIDLKVVDFTDYVTPNLALADGELDANYFQHKPYLDKFCEEKGLKLNVAGGVHVEPIGVFSAKLKSIDDIPNKATVAIPNDPSNGGRALILLHNAGIITLNDPTNLYATEFDVAKNPKKLKFKTLEAAQLPRVLKDVDFAVINGATEFDVAKNPKKLKFKTLEAAQLPRVLKDVDFAVINGNYALEAGLNPAEDSLLLEGKESPYTNIVAVKAGDEKREEIVKLINALNSPETAEFINTTYKGAVVGKESPYTNIVAVKAGDEKREEIVKLINALNSPETAEFINTTYKGAVVPAF